MDDRMTRLAGAGAGIAVAGGLVSAAGPDLSHAAGDLFSPAHAPKQTVSCPGQSGPRSRPDTTQGQRRKARAGIARLPSRPARNNATDLRRLAPKSQHIPDLASRHGGGRTT